jgi:stage IV sporulation protein FB
MPLFRVFGITLWVHPTFWLLPLALAAHFYPRYGWLGVRDAWWAMFLIYTCVVLHEFGHAFAARRLGVFVSEIFLLPVGGMAVLGRIPRQPSAELLIVAAGPLVNFVLAGLAALALHFFGHWPTNPDALDPASFRRDDLLGFLLLANLGLGLFNLIPAFPMDGGRLLRAALAYYFNYLRATWLAMMIGRFFALGGILFAIFYAHYLMALLFTFILFLGDLEYRQLAREESSRRFFRFF